VRIPLDYYRILGLPIQATAEQLRQAHRDRTLQLPRREYSDAAIASRRKLLDEAYAVLSDPQQRQTYDASFLAKTYELEPEPSEPSASVAAGDTGTDSHTPSIEIQDDQLVGALLILQDLGEYELVLKLGRPFLTGGSASLKGGQYGDPNIVYSDIVLTVALACLELGREQWQQSQYENAAEALETGQQLLLREGLFAGVRGEIQADLYKLRPYRVLELLALPETQTEERYRGMQLLQDMLHERDGIDGSGDDQSGLNIDDFLRFIQQLRSYLTASEQQVLFEQEAQRPSAVATYLAVYALLAGGFADRQPVLVRRAKMLLMRLSSRQDVHLEQAVCALLLGQTEEASRALELSQEYGPIAFIREHSQGSPDLLPGLCLYAERWLQDEVFPHFRDLSRQQASLKEYFADPQVQAYLEELPNETDATSEWMVEQTQPAPIPSAQASSGPALAARSNLESPPVMEPVLARGEQPLNKRLSDEALIETARSRIAARTATATLTDDRALDDIPSMTAAERVGQASSNRAVTRPAGERMRSDRLRNGGGRSNHSSPAPHRSGDAVEERVRPRPSNSKGGGIFHYLPYGAVIVGMIALGFLIAWLIKTLQVSGARQTQQAQQIIEEQPLVKLDEPLVKLEESAVDAASEATLTTESAQQLIESWLAAKAAAMGPEHAVEKLDQILAEPKLTEWRAAADAEKQAGNYRKYTHKVKVSSVEQNKDKPDEAKVAAEVSETTEYYKGDQLDDTRSDPELQVQYDLIRVDDKWRIQNWQVVQ
jgi:hypothetical protein